MKKVIIIVIVLLVAAGGGYLILMNNDKKEEDQAATVEQRANSFDTEAPAVDASTSEAGIITYTDDGFSPNDMTVTAGTVITVKNQSSSMLDFASDDHPTHKINSELNVGDIEPGKSATFTPMAGTWGYHNHLNARDTGSITVTE